MDEITAFDWQRLIFGTFPALFYGEILFRILVIWLWSMVLLRWIGGRSISQLSLVEFLLVIALGSAVGDGMFYPEVPLLHVLLVITVLILLDKLVDYTFRRFDPAKKLIDGVPVQLLEEGVLLCEGITARHMGAMEVMEMLRLRGVENLGSLRSVWLEPSGQISVFPTDPPRPGLPIVPPVELVQKSTPAGGETLCCAGCGLADAGPPLSEPACPNCAGVERVPARPAPPWRI